MSGIRRGRYGTGAAAVCVVLAASVVMGGCVAETMTQIPLTVHLGEGATCGDIRIEVLMESKQALEQKDVGKPVISPSLSPF